MRIVDLVSHFHLQEMNVDVHDYWVDPIEAWPGLHVAVAATLERGVYAAFLPAFGHQEVRDRGSHDIDAVGKPHGHVVFELKAVLPRDTDDARL
jgi:UDP-N-acetyl-D-glucosamine/UDP-N-acetyl-D-galactosamine dehydrogenase